MSRNKHRPDNADRNKDRNCVYETGAGFLANLFSDGRSEIEAPPAATGARGIVLEQAQAARPATRDRNQLPGNGGRSKYVFISVARG